MSDRHCRLIPYTLLSPFLFPLHTWLNGSSVEYALAMQKPMTDDALELGRQRAFRLSAV